MPVKIKLKRFGKIHSPQYRVVIADSRTARNGRAIEEIGIYRPLNDPSLIQIDSDRVAYWLGVGAQPTEPVMALLKVTGDWQKFKGVDGGSGTLRVAEPKQGRDDYFAAMVTQSEKDKEKASKSPPEVPQPRKKKAAEPEAAATTDSAPAEPTTDSASEPTATEPEAATSTEPEAATSTEPEAAAATDSAPAEPEAATSTEPESAATTEPTANAATDSAPEETPANAEEPTQA